MSRIYNNMSTFDIARDDDLDVTAFGVYYRHGEFRYFVSEDNKLHEFSTAGAAIQSFDLLCDMKKETAMNR
jgi:hypothetical protein